MINCAKLKILLKLLKAPLYPTNLLYKNNDKLGNTLRPTEYNTKPNGNTNYSETFNQINIIL